MWVERKVAVYERTGDPKEPYVLIKKFRGNENDNDIVSRYFSKQREGMCEHVGNDQYVSSIVCGHTGRHEGQSVQGSRVSWYSSQGISSLDVSVNRPIFVTCDTSDRQISIWNYLNWKCEFTQELPFDPTCVALHPSGFIVLVATKARVKLLWTRNMFLSCHSNSNNSFSRFENQCSNLII